MDDIHIKKLPKKTKMEGNTTTFISKTTKLIFVNNYLKQTSQAYFSPLPCLGRTIFIYLTRAIVSHEFLGANLDF